MLPTCPACKQSVLDDDATECPFCGADMKTGKGGGGSKPAAPKAAAPAAKAAPASKSAPSAAKPASTARKPILDDDDDDPFASKGEEDDPFAAAATEGAASRAKATPVTPKKTKTNTVELKCPMCDSVGYVPENMGGKDVKCYNPSCKAPVFMVPKNLAPPVLTTPVKPVKAPKAANPNSKKPLILAIVGAVALCVIAGAAVYFWPDSSAAGPEEFDFKKAIAQQKQEREAQGLPPVDPAIANTGETKPKPEENAAEKAVPVQETLDVAGLLKLMEDRSLEEKLVNKKYCRQRTAIGYALVGNVEGMKSEFQSLEQVEKTVPHFKIPGYVTLGWYQLGKADKAAATGTAGEALTAASQIGKGSRDTQDAVIELAALLVATGKTADATKLLTTNLRPDASTPLIVSDILARHRGDFDLTVELPGTIPNPHKAWPFVGVTLILTTHGLWTEARQWAEAAPGPDTITDCVVAWADARLRDTLAKKAPADPDVEGVAAKLTPGGKVQLFARLAMTHAAGNPAEAERLIAAAQGALKDIAQPPLARCDGFKDALDWKAPDSATLRQATLGAAALGQAQVRAKKKDEGWLSTVAALNYARGIAPGPVAVDGVKAAMESLDLESLRDKVRTTFMLRSRDEAIRKTRELQGRVTELEAQSHGRFQLQDAILKAAAAAGLTAQVWEEARSLSQRNDPNEVEPYLAGTLPLYLIEEFQAAGASTEAAEVQKRIEGVELPADDVLELKQIIATALKNNNFGEAIAAFNQRKLSGAAEEAALVGFIEAAKRDGQAIPTLALADSMDTKANPANQFVKLEVTRLLAAFAARQGKPDAVRSTIQSSGLTSLEKISGYLGLLEGYEAWKHAQAAAATAAPKATEGTAAK